LALFSELPATRRLDVGSSIHYIASVLDREAMTTIVDSLSESVFYKSGTRVKTLKGSLRGTITAVLEVGRLRWRADTGTEFLALPESPVPDDCMLRSPLYELPHRQHRLSASLPELP
jgi:hypothetical protein